jgi:MULE transposase domain
MSLDACHLKSQWKGTLYVASVTTGLDEIYPVAFAITESNEDYMGGKFFLENLHSSIPFISQPNPLDRVSFARFIFVSDSDKGLDKALFDVFPNNHSIHCAVHIQRNVWTKYGVKASSNVPAIAACFRIEKRMSYLQKYKYILGLQEYI